MYLSDKGDIQNVHCWCASRNRVGKHCSRVNVKRFYRKHFFEFPYTANLRLKEIMVCTVTLYVGTELAGIAVLFYKFLEHLRVPKTEYFK